MSETRLNQLKDLSHPEWRHLDTFVDLIQKREPFAFTRWGDGEWWSILGRTEGQNVDGLAYDPALGEDLRRVLTDRPPYMLGLQDLALEIFAGEVEQWLTERALDELDWINAAVFHGASRDGNLGPFLDTLRAAPRLVVVGPPHLAALEPLLGYHTFVKVPPHDSYRAKDVLLTELVAIAATLPKGAVFSISAGMTANILIDALTKTNAGKRLILLDIGSLWDPYAGVKSRVYMQDMAILPDAPLVPYTGVTTDEAQFLKTLRKLSDDERADLRSLAETFLERRQRDV